MDPTKFHGIVAKHVERLPLSSIATRNKLYECRVVRDDLWNGNLVGKIIALRDGETDDASTLIVLVEITGLAIYTAPTVKEATAKLVAKYDPGELWPTMSRDVVLSEFDRLFKPHEHIHPATVGAFALNVIHVSRK